MHLALEYMCILFRQAFAVGFSAAGAVALYTTSHQMQQGLAAIADQVRDNLLFLQSRLDCKRAAYVDEDQHELSVAQSSNFEARLAKLEKA